MRHLYLSIIFLFLTQLAFSQQYPLFTNFMMNRYGFNPAINMDSAGVVANLVYRNQWTGLEGAPKTMVAGLRGRLKPVPVGIGGYFSTIRLVSSIALAVTVCSTLFSRSPKMSAFLSAVQWGIIP